MTENQVYIAQVRFHRKSLQVDETSSIQIEAKGPLQLAGIFLDSKSAEKYIKTHYHDYESSSIAFELPENRMTYFDQFRVCDSCEDVSRDRHIYMVQEKHGNEWHLRCILTQLLGGTISDDVEIRYLTLKLPCKRDKFFAELKHEIISSRERDEKVKADRREKSKSDVLLLQLSIQNHWLLKLIATMLFMHILVSVLFH